MDSKHQIHRERGSSMDASGWHAAHFEQWSHTATGALCDLVLLGEAEGPGEGSVGALVGATLGDLVTLEPWQWPWEPW
jgi:hypothetical protein